VPALFDTGALELLRRRHRRVEVLALKHYPPVVCSHVVGEFLYAQFHARVPEPDLVAARIFLAPFEMLVPSLRTPDLCAELRANLHAKGVLVPEPVCWIAAQALEHGFPVVTTDRDFRRVPGLKVHLVTLPKTLGRTQAAGQGRAETGNGAVSPVAAQARPEGGLHLAPAQEKRRPACAGRL
jgi:predicted nucleic acid-binding protein